MKNAFKMLLRVAFLGSIWPASLMGQSVRSSEFDMGLAFPFTTSLQIGANIPLTAGPVYLLRFSRKFLHKNNRYWIAEMSWLYSRLQYQAGDEQKAGSLYQLGFGGGYGLALGKDLFVRSSLSLTPLAGLSAGSAGSLSVNDREVKYATLSTFSGGIGFQPRISLTKSYILFKWKIPLATSVSLFNIYHSFGKRKDQSVISDAGLAVVPQASENKAQISLTALEFSASLGF